MRQGLLILLTFFTLTSLLGQVDTLDWRKHKKIKEHTTPWGYRYWVNDTIVDGQTYMDAIKSNDNLRKMLDSSTYDKPVWVKLYHNNGQLGAQGLRCGECNTPIGLYTTYYENGNIKMKRTYVRITNKKELKKRKKETPFQWCSEEDGQRIFYDEKGQLKHIDFLEMGKLIRCENYKDGKLIGTNCG